jgi:predicted N-acetyltransferase YhbS
MNTAVIRLPTEADVPAIARLTAQLGYAESVESMRTRLQRIVAHQEHLLLVAQSGEEVCGWLQALRAEVVESGTRVEILGLVVAEDRRREGIGSQLVARAEEWARQLGVEAVVVRTNVIRSQSQQFYAALGYQQTKTQAVYRKGLAN